MTDIISELEDKYFTHGGEVLRRAILEISKRDKLIAALQAKILILEARKEKANEERDGNNSGT
jgi:hypothetical protein